MRVFIESEAGSTLRRTHDASPLKHLKAAQASHAYPYPYGFVLGTRSGDGHAVDCFVLTRTPLKSGAIAPCLAVGLLEQIEDGGAGAHKVLAVLPDENVMLNPAILGRITRFIGAASTHKTGKRKEAGQLLGRAEAEAYVQKCSLGGRLP